jgi:hypothetical protein
MKKVLIIVGIIIVLAVIGVVVFMPKGPDEKDFENLLAPKISEMPDQNMLVVEVKGDPAKAAMKAIKLLYGTYYKLDGVPKSFKPIAPRARWPFEFNTPKDQWIGVFGLPIPDAVTSLPEIKNPDSLKIYIAKWQYGTVAEVLHKGSYADEIPTIKALADYITQQGYKIVGEHEEDYIKGPGMFGPGKPENYLTIIRYRVEKLIRKPPINAVRKETYQ